MSEMEELVRHLVTPLLDHPDDLEIDANDDDAVVEFVLTVHDDDRETVDGQRGRTLRSIRNVLSAAAGSKKVSVDLAGDDDRDDDDEDEDDE